MNIIQNRTMDEERALYGLHNAEVVNCEFSGSLDGESALKECGNTNVKNCRFLLRYPLWHLNGGSMENSLMTETCRAAMWYDKNFVIENTEINGIKAIRECDDVTIKKCKINSEEFGWFCRRMNIENCGLVSVYPFLQCRNLEINGLKMQG